MAKQGMKRPEVTHIKSKKIKDVPVISGKAKHGNKKAPILPVE